MTDTKTNELPQRYLDDVFSGRSFEYVRASHASADRMNYCPMIQASEYSAFVVTLGKAAALGDFYAEAIRAALLKVSPYLNGHQIMAGVAGAFAEVQRSGWHDIRTATGPEAGRPSSWDHPTTEAQTITLLAILNELQFCMHLGSVPGVGWALAQLIRERGIRINALYLPNVAAQLHRQ